MANTKIAICIFQTYIDGRLAQSEVEADPIVMNSRDGRDAAAALARIAFANLHPAFDKRQPIKCVDIIVVDRATPDPTSKARGN